MLLAAEVWRCSPAALEAWCHIAAICRRAGGYFGPGHDWGEWGPRPPQRCGVTDPVPMIAEDLRVVSATAAALLGLERVECEHEPILPRGNWRGRPQSCGQLAVHIAGRALGGEPAGRIAASVSGRKDMSYHRGHVLLDCARQWLWVHVAVDGVEAAPVDALEGWAI